MNKKRVLITGASRGIGKAIAIYLADKGLSVVGTTRNPDKLADDLKDSNIRFVGMDVTDIDSVKKGVKEASEILKGIDILINNAGISHIGPFEEMPEDQGRAVLETDFFGVAAVIKAALPVIRESSGENGFIINISSLGGRMGIPFQSYYVAAKFALEGLSESLRMELIPQGIKVVLIEPGNIMTDIASHHLLCDTDSPHYEEIFSKTREIIRDTVKDAESPEVVARLVYKIINKKRPKVRYPAGKGSGNISLLIKLFPQSLTEKLLLNYYNIKKRG